MNMSSVETPSDIPSNEESERNMIDISSTEQGSHNNNVASHQTQEGGKVKLISDENQTESSKIEESVLKRHNSKLAHKRSAEFPEHPLVIIERHERDITAKIGAQVNLDEKFVISNYKNPDSKEKTPQMTIENLEVITQNCFPSEKDKQSIQNGDDWGNPKCLTVLPQKHIAIGTSRGIILIFNSSFNRIQKFGTNKEREFGAVTALDIAPKNDDVVCGYENGNIVLWSMAKNERLKTINAPEKSPVLGLKFFKETSGSFLMSTVNGSVYQYKVDFILFQWKVDKKLLSLQDDGKNDKKPKNESVVKKDNFESLPNGYFIIQPLPKKLYNPRNPNKNLRVALASMKEILIISLEPFKILYRHARPLGIPDTINPCLSWGRGTVPEIQDNTDPILAFSWGKTVHLVQVKNIEPKQSIDDYYYSSEEEDEEEEEVEKIRIAGYFNCKEDIHLLEWVSQNTLLAFNTFGEFLVINPGGFKSPNVSAEIKIFSYADVVIGSIPFPDEIQYQIFNGVNKAGEAQKSVMYYSNTVKGSEPERQIIILGKKRVLSLKHLEWQEYIDDLGKKSEWFSAMAICVSLYRSYNRMFANVPSIPAERKKSVQSFAVGLARKYIASIQHPVKVFPRNTVQNEAWTTALVSVIDFMLCTENYEPLFAQIQRMTEELCLKDLFLECLEPFILRGRVKCLTNDAFKEIVKHYTEKEKLDVLQYLVINLSPKEIDMDYAIILCMQYNLLTALMYLCSHKDDLEGPDLLTPLASALGRYQRSIEENNPKDEYGFKFLWFLHMTLHGRLFPDRVLSQKIWELKVKDAIILLFEEKNLDLMLKIEPYVAYETLELLFQPNLANLIKSFDDSSIKLFATWNDNNKDSSPSSKEAKIDPKLKNDINRFIASIQNTLQGQILGLIYYCSRKSEEYSNHLFYLLAKLCVHYNCKIPIGIAEETLFYLLNNSYELPPWKSSTQEILDELHEQRSVLILGLLKELEPQDLEEISRLVEKLDLVDVTSYILGLTNEFEKALDLYLNQSTEAKKNKVFDWLREIIPRMAENQEEYDKVKKILISKLHDLVTINGEKTRHIMLGLGSELEMEIIQHLESSPSLQLEYVREVISKREDRDTIPDDLLILHIKLLCEIDPKQVLREIRTYNYPLDACLKLVRDYKVKDALALLLERTGHLNEALEIHIEIFKDCLDEKLKKIKEKAVFSICSRALTRKFDNISNACSEYTKLGTIEIGKMWLSVLDKLLEYYQDYVSTAKPGEEVTNQMEYLQKAAGYKELSQTYVRYISSFTEEMSKNVAIETILKRLKAFKGLKLGELKDAFLGMLLGHFYETNILTKSQDLIMEANCKDTQSIYSLSAKGLKVERSKIMKDDDNDEEVIVFLCGHVFNQEQLEENNACLVCMDTEPWKAQNIVKTYTRKGSLLTKTSRNLGAKPGASSTGTTQMTKSTPVERDRSVKRKKSTKNARKPEYRNQCLNKMDRFEEWRTTDLFGWQARDDLPKFKKSPSVRKET